MCNPAYIALGAMAVGAVTSAVGAKNASQARKDAANYNASVQDQLALDAERRGAESAGQLRMETRQLKGSQVAALAANGIDVNQGSALDILAGTDMLSILDEETLLRNAAREAYGYRTEATMYRRAADSESPSRAFMTSLIGGATQVAGSWYTMNSVGAFGGGSTTSSYNTVGARGNWYGPGPAQR